METFEKNLENIGNPDSLWDTEEGKASKNQKVLFVFSIRKGSKFTRILEKIGKKWKSKNLRELAKMLQMNRIPLWL